MSTNITIASGPKWHIHLDHYYNRVWLRLKELHEDAEVEIVRPVEGSHDVEVSVMLPDDLAQLFRDTL